MDNFLEPSISPDDDFNAYNFAGIRGFHKKIFSLLDNKTLEVSIILYAAKSSSNTLNTMQNGIAVITEDGDLIVDNLKQSDSAIDAATQEQIDLFEELIDYNSFPDFADAVNRIGKDAGRLRMEL